MKNSILAAALILAAISGPAGAADWPSSMRDILAYCRSPDVDPYDAMDGRRLLTDKQCALRILERDDGAMSQYCESMGESWGGGDARYWEEDPKTECARERPCVGLQVW
jgi:hypothetical protein